MYGNRQPYFVLTIAPLTYKRQKAFCICCTDLKKNFTAHKKSSPGELLLKYRKAKVNPNQFTTNFL